MLANILFLAGGLVAGVIAALTVIAPRTKNTVDDKILLFAEDVEKVIQGLGGAASAAAQGVVVQPATAAK